MLWFVPVPAELPGMSVVLPPVPEITAPLSTLYRLPVTVPLFVDVVLARVT